MKRRTKAVTNTLKRNQKIVAVSVAGAVAMSGLYLTFQSSAATLFVSLEPEDSTLSSKVVFVTDTQASGGSAVQFGQGTASCTISATLVNSCRPWLGAFSNYYPGVSGFRNHILDHERRIDRQLDIVHNFHPEGNLPLNNDEKFFIQRENTIALINWKPADRFVEGAGGNATVNAQIDQVADSMKSVAPKKVMVVLYHEPENDVSGGISCTTPKGSQGTPAEYRAMWQNVRSRFDARGVTNVVWVMNYMGFSNWNCIVKDLWPGNNLVDWVMWNPYSGADSLGYEQSMSQMYNWMTANSDTQHNFLSKPWGLGEWGIGKGSSGGYASQESTYKWYQDMKATVEANKYPMLKAYVTFDMQGVHDTQTSYTTITHIFDHKEEDEYKAYASSPAFKNP